jgi:hypothetical protein
MTYHGSATWRKKIVISCVTYYAFLFVRKCVLTAKCLHVSLYVCSIIPFQHNGGFSWKLAWTTCASDKQVSLQFPTNNYYTNIVAVQLLISNFVEKCSIFIDKYAYLCVCVCIYIYVYVRMENREYGRGDVLHWPRDIL